MTERNLNNLIAALFVLFLLGAIGCGDRVETETIVEVANCSVSRIGTDAVVTCPDGTELILPAVVINETIIEINPVVIQVPKTKCKKD